MKQLLNFLDGFLARAAGVFVGGYRIFLSPLLGGHCRFFPSCSQYAEEALERHGFSKGLVIAGGRLLRCHPFGRSGYDPVLK